MLPIINSPINPLFNSPYSGESIDEKNLRQLTWLREMEKQQLSDWLTHPFLSTSSDSAVQNKNVEATENLFGATQHRFLSNAADADDADKNEDSSIHDTSGRAEAQSESRAPEKSGTNATASSNHELGNDAAAIDHTASSGASLQNGVGRPPENITADDTSASEETSSAAKENGERLVTISSDLQKMLSDLGITKFQIGAAFAGPDEAESELIARMAANKNAAGQEEVEDADDHASGARSDAAAAIKTNADSSYSADVQKLRLHAELKNDQAHVWIGADRSLQLVGKKLDDLSEQLQQLFSEQGTPLVSLTFNGRPLMDAPAGDLARWNQNLPIGTEAQLGGGKQYAFASLDNEQLFRNT